MLSSDPIWREAAASVLRDLVPKKPAATHRGTSDRVVATPDTRISEAVSLYTPLIEKISIPTGPELFNFASSSSRGSPAKQVNSFSLGAGKFLASPMGAETIGPAFASTANVNAIGYPALLSTGLSRIKLSTFVCANCGETGHWSLLCTAPYAICGVFGHTRMECRKNATDPFHNAASKMPAMNSLPDHGEATNSTSNMIPCVSGAKNGHNSTLQLQKSRSLSGIKAPIREQYKKTGKEPHLVTPIAGPTPRLSNVNLQPTAGDTSGNTEHQKKRKLGDEAEMTQNKSLGGYNAS